MSVCVCHTNRLCTRKKSSRIWWQEAEGGAEAAWKELKEAVVECAKQHLTEEEVTTCRNSGSQWTQ